MTQLWQRLVTLVGPRHDLSPDLAARVAIVNILAAVALVAVAVFSAIQWVGGYEYLVGTNMVTGCVLGVVLWLNRIGRHLAARFLLLACVNLDVLVYSYVFGTEIGLRQFVFPLIAVPFVLFLASEWRAVAVSCLGSLVVAVVLLVEAEAWAYGAIPLTPDVRRAMQQVYGGLAIIVMLLPPLALFLMNRVINQRLVDRQARLTQAEKLSSLGILAAGIAHEINNPLAIISGSTHLLSLNKTVKADGALQDRVDKIQSTTMRISRIVRSILLFSRDASAVPREVHPVSSVMEVTLDLCRELLKHRGIDLRLEIEAGLSVYSGASEVSQVLLNLISNAADAADAGTLKTDKWVSIEARTADVNGQVEFAVGDSGDGVPAAIRLKILDPFFTTKEVGKGTGLGLSISSSIVGNLGGSLWLDTAARYTRFVFTVPAGVPAVSAGKVAA